MSKTVKLEVDPSIIERNLDFGVNLFKDEENDDPLSRLFPKSNPSPDEIPWKLVQPKPGFVLKLRTIEGDKVFLNICHCTELPTPRDISEEELIALCDSEDPSSSYMVPMSIGDLHVEADKSGNLASTYDIAVSSQFYDKLLEKSLFKDFFISVISDGIENKHSLQFDKDFDVVILKNKKSFGTLQTHRVQQRPVRTAPKKLIEELPDSCRTDDSTNYKCQKPLIEEFPDTSSEQTSDMVISEDNAESSNNDMELLVAEKNKVKLIKTPKEGPAEKLIAFISISAFTGKDLELNVGEDRILINAPRKSEMLDFFLPYNVDRDSVSAKYLVNKQTLRIDLPVKS